MALKPGPPVKASVVVKQAKKAQASQLVGYTEDFTVPEGHTPVNVAGVTIIPMPSSLSKYYGAGNQDFLSPENDKLFETVYSPVAPEFLKQKCFLLHSAFTWKLVKSGNYSVLVPYKKLP